MADYIALDAAVVSAQIAAMLAAYPELAYDEELLSSALEGETDLHRIMSRLVRMRQERRANIKGLADYIKELSERKARLERSDEATTKLIKKLMEVAKVKQVYLPEATISETKGRQSVSVTDVNELDQGFYITERKPDTEAIRTALMAGEKVSGAQLITSENGVTVRNK